MINKNAKKFGDTPFLRQVDLQNRPIFTVEMCMTLTLEFTIGEDQMLKTFQSKGHMQLSELATILFVLCVIVCALSMHELLNVFDSNL